MAPAQEQLLASFPGFMNALAGAARRSAQRSHRRRLVGHGGRRDGSSTAGRQRRQRRVSVHAPRPCTATPLTGGATYIINEGGTANYTGTIEDAFTCIANLGQTGCGLEQQLLSVTPRARRGRHCPTRREPGFPAAERQPRDRPHLQRRRLLDAARGGTARCLWTMTQVLVRARSAPCQNFRCNEFGHTCAEGTPNRNAPGGEQTAMVSYTNCVSNEQSTFLKSVGSFVAEIKALKAAPDQQIIVAGFLGVSNTNPTGPLPYTVAWRTPPLTDTGPWPLDQGRLRDVARGSSATLPSAWSSSSSAFGDDGLIFSHLRTQLRPGAAGPGPAHGPATCRKPEKS